ncbi:amidase family protein, partial [Vogesella mureinivorans]|uniref:amidase family protein n=1 Tax=Vogesella mureinivorans TaxID=657276 RepID=UPI001F118320
IPIDRSAELLHTLEEAISDTAQPRKTVTANLSNVPEFALGSHSYNPVFGTTHNAYAYGRAAEGSTGGGAVALALRMVPVADGSDFG